MRSGFFIRIPRDIILAATRPFKPCQKIENLAGKTNYEISYSWVNYLFNRYNTELIEHARNRKYIRLFHYPDGHRAKITIQKPTMTIIEGTETGITVISLFSEN
jgi:hypothetical protein